VQHAPAQTGRLNTALSLAHPRPHPQVVFLHVKGKAVGGRGAPAPTPSRCAPPAPPRTRRTNDVEMSTTPVNTDPPSGALFSSLTGLVPGAAPRAIGKHRHGLRTQSSRSRPWPLHATSIAHTTPLAAPGPFPRALRGKHHGVAPFPGGGQAHRCRVAGAVARAGSPQNRACAVRNTALRDGGLRAPPPAGLRPRSIPAPGPWLDGPGRGLPDVGSGAVRPSRSAHARRSTRCAGRDRRPGRG
jgi:hypothetical protein